MRNRVHDNTNGGVLGAGISMASEMGGLLEDIRIHDNIVYHNRAIGIEANTSGFGFTHPMKNIYIVNNTCIIGRGAADLGNHQDQGPAQAEDRRVLDHRHRLHRHG